MFETNISDTQDEINNSQPISLPSSINSDIAETDGTFLTKHTRPPKFAGQRGNFRSKEEIDSKYRHIFTYPYFNEVQSRVIEDALYSDKSMVVCAPTGSGKTVIFEMAIVQLLMELEDKNYTDDFKIIYMAPVKALCTERLTEWYPKFTKLGHLCIEVTGDTDVEFPQLKPYRIIITTPEKWDMLTRRWKDHRSLVEVIKLFLIDEVHILNDETRGPVLEAVVSRMKTIESSVQSTNRIEKLLAQYQDSNCSSTNITTLRENNSISIKPIRIRFIAISATVSNPQDVADWLGTSEKPAVYYKFGDECRPVKLKRIVEGYPCPAGTSIFKFDIILNYKLWNIIQKYHNGKPTLIFCNTRKSVMLTAETLSREITVSFNTEQKNKLMALASTIKTKKIQSLILSGVGCHHAGLLFEERINIEIAFRNRDLPILITTTTLAMGVNLPAHLVIIKNTQQYVNGAYQEYSISTILQMVGRAGRPQYDTEATAVIMTRSQDKARYQALVEGSEPLQSYLHKRLAENLNSEAALGTVCDVAQCVQWVNSTFLSVRAARDPRRYLGLPHAAPAQLISKKIEELCVKAMNGLATAGLISMDEACCIESTEAGRLMSIYYLDLETMKLIMKLEGSESLERLLWLICESHELSDMHLRVDERRCLNSLNRNTAAATIRFPMKGKISSRQMKLSCVIQAVLGCLAIPDPSLNQESTKIMRIADRVCKCLVYYVTRPNFISNNPKFFSTILNSLTLAKCVYARLWENSPYVSRQLKGIGPIFSTLLASAGKVSFMLLEESHPRDLERIMNKGPPVGNIIRRQVSLLPKYRLTATPIDEKTVQIQLSLLNHAYLSENMDHLTAGVNHKSYIIAGDTENYLLYLNSFKETDLINVYDGCITFQITRKHNTEHEILIHCISSTYVGIDEHCKYLFKDINPFPKSNVNADRKFLDKSPHKADDIFKERKRKTKDTSIAHCNEKKKRDIKFVEKFNNLKDFFGRTSTDIKQDLDKTTEMSNRLLNNLEPAQETSNNIANKELEVTENLNDSFENIFAEDFNDDDFIDDDKVSDILNEIENEIKSDKNVVTEPKQRTNKIFPSSVQITNTFSAKRKNITTKDNFNFINKLEPKIDTSNDENECNIQQETGFNDSIKLHIQNYLKRAQDYKNTKNDLIDLVESEKTCNTKDDNSNELITTVNMDTNFNKFQDTDSIQIENGENIINNDSKIKMSQPHTVQSWIDYLPECENILKSIEAEQNNLNVHTFDISNKNKIIEKSSQSSELNRSNIITVDNKNDSNNINDERALITYPSRFQQQNYNNIINSITNNCNYENVTVEKENAYNQDKNQIVPPDYQNYGKDETNINSNSENFEYIRKYKASQTQLFNITSENQKQKVKIVGKLKIDLDVTEIVHKNEKPTSNIDSDIITCNSRSISHNPYLNKSINVLEILDRSNEKPQSNEFNDNIRLGDTKVFKSIILPSYNDDSKENHKIRNDNKENLSVKDILLKYNNIATRANKETISLNKQVNTQKDVKDTKEANKINKRKLRISDIDKIQIELPTSLIGTNQSISGTCPELNKIENTPYLSQTRKHIPTYRNDNIKLVNKINLENNNLNNEIEIDERPDFTYSNEHQYIHRDENNLITDNSLINDIELPSSDLTTELADDNFESELDIDNAILNPKALLQTMHRDEENEIIPPPLQFCDDTYSPAHSSQEQNKFEDLTVYNDVNETLNNKFTSDFENNYSIFQENNDIELTPSKEIETWSPSHVIMSPYSSPGQSFTDMRKNLTETNNTLDFPSSRRAKLSHFKFKRKSVLRK